MTIPCDENGLRIVLVGGTDLGKSTTANVILGNHRLQNYDRLSTEICEHTCIKCAKRLGTRITIVNTPRVFNNSDTYKKIETEMSYDSKHIAIFYTVYHKMTEEDRNNLDLLIENLDSNTRTKMFLVRTDCEDVTSNLDTNVRLPVLRVTSTLQGREAEYQVKVILEKIQSANATLKTRPTIVLSIFKSTTVILIIVIVLSHSAQGSNPDTNQVVYWKLMTKPAYFGGNIELECVIRTEKTSTPMSWIIIPNGETIASDKIPTDDDKYGINVKYDATEMIYNLTIKRLNPNDVNRIYRCDFGFHSYAEKLQLNDRDFISRPKEKDMKYNFSLVERSLFGTVKIEKGYPEPLCYGIFEGNNLSEAMRINSTNDSSIFLNTNIEVNYSTEICRGTVNVTCRYGDYEIQIIQLVDVCSVSSESNQSIVAVVIGSLLVVMIAVAIILLLKMKLERSIKSCFPWSGGIPTSDLRQSLQPKDGQLPEDNSNDKLLVSTCI